MPKAHRIDFDDLKARADFAAVLLHYRINLVGSGEQAKVLCPFHDDERPSCSVNLAKRLWHCFRGCGAGNVLDFVHRMETRDGASVSLRQAAERLAAICGLGDGDRRAAPRPREPRRGSTTKETALLPFDGGNVAPGGPERARTAPGSGTGPACNKPLGFRLTLDPAHPYLAARGVAPELAERFGLGFCGKGSMAGRVAIPIEDARGELVAYAGRWAGDEADLPAGEEKYKLPKGFRKNLELFNLHRIRPYIHLVVVEGYFGAVRLHGLRIAAAALMGSSIAEEQVALLRGHCPNLRHVTVLTDGDDAGRKAAVAVAHSLSRHWWTFTALLPEGTQPDTAAEHDLLAALRRERRPLV